MTTARVSVIIPCFNLGRYLDEAIASVHAQSCPDVEIVVVDDGSTDAHTRDVLEAGAWERTRVIRTANRGLPAAKNAGLGATSAPIVCMLDADDRLLPAMIERSLATLDADPGLAFASHWLRTFGDEEGEWTPERCDFPVLLDVNTVNGAALVRREALEDVGGFDEAMRDGCEDWDIWIALTARGHRGAIIPEVLFEYRRRPGSMSRVMMTGATHPELYRYLAAKHAEVFRAHLPYLLERRERDATAARRHVHDLEIDWHEHVSHLVPDRRDDLAALGRRVALREQAARAERQPSEHQALVNALAEIEALHESASWRITAPVRAMYAALSRRRGGGS